MWGVCILSFFVAIASAQTNYPFTLSQSLSAATPIVSDYFSVNAKAGSQMTITHYLGVQVCFHTRPLRGISPLFWNISCHHHYSYEASMQGRPVTRVQTVFLRDAPRWYVGIALSDLTATATDNINFLLGVAGDSCNQSGLVYDLILNECFPVEMINATNSSAPMTLARDEVRYFQFIVPANNIGSIMAYVPSIPDESKLIFLFRLMGTPTNTHKDGTSGSTAYLAFPPPGLYTLRVRATTNVTDIVFALRFETCSGTNMTGPSCATFYNSSVANMYTQTRGDYPMYWALPCPANSVSSVSIRPDDGDLWNYQIFASMGQLPQSDNADIPNCYASSCLGAWNINITTGPEPETWYISVLPKFSNRTYSIWFNSICAPDCVKHGLCETSGPFIGRCNCAADYTGAACQLSNKLSAQYIVLIIIACLLFTSAIVGFIAQAYLKRKGYQNL